MYGLGILVPPRTPTPNCDAKDSLVEEARKGKCAINHTRYRRNRRKEKTCEKDTKDPTWKYLARRVCTAVYLVHSAESFVSPAALRSSRRSSPASFRVGPRSVSLELRDFLRSDESAERTIK